MMEKNILGGLEMTTVTGRKSVRTGIVVLKN